MTIDRHPGAVVDETAHVSGSAYVGYGCKVLGHAEVMQEATLRDGAEVRERAIIGGRARVVDSLVTGRAAVTGDSIVMNGSVVCGDASVHDEAIVEYARIHGGSVRLRSGHISLGAHIFKPDHVIVIQGMFPGMVTIYRTDDGPMVQAGCQRFALNTPGDALRDLADDYSWHLPVAWRRFRYAMIEQTARWADDVCEMCVDGTAPVWTG